MTRVALTTAGLLLAAACTSEPKGASSVGSSLPPVSLPDLSRMDTPVQEQMNERYQSLLSTVDKPGTSSTERARAYGHMGNLLLAAEYFEAAEPCYLHAQALDPDDVRWPYYLGHVYMARADLAKSAASFERALRLQPGDVATQVWLGDVYLDQGRPELAEPLFAQALSIQPRLVSAHVGLGQAALTTREYARAADHFEQALAADPRASIVHYPLALAYRGLGDTARAEVHLRQRGDVEVGPPDPLMLALREELRGAVAEEERGMRALNSGDFPAAAAHFRKSVELAPDNPSLRHKLGTALSLTGDARGAVEQFQEVVRRSPTFSQAHFSLGVLLAAGGRHQEAIAHFTTAVRHEPNYVEARLQLADTLGRSGQFEKALIQYRQVLTIDPRSADARYGYAMALLGLQRYPDARDALSEGAKLAPDDPRFADALGRFQRAVPGNR